MTDLSPAAQAVFWAFNSKFDWIEDGIPGPQFNAIAAAIRAAADQVVQQEEPPANFLDVQVAAEIDQRRATRADFLAIADELEGITFGTYRCDLEK